MELTLTRALDLFYEKHGYGREGGIDSDWIWLKFRYFSLPIPNVKGRRENVWRHDMLHILLDYDTSWQGEAQVAGWVLGSGGWGRFYVAWLFALSMFSVAITFFPLKTFRAFVRGRNTLSPYLLGITKENLYADTLPSLKKQFKFDLTPFKATLTDRLLFGFWFLVGLLWLMLPILTVLFVFYAFM
ncbi:MAG: hypothetical protein MUF58_02635 [Arcicella sp.]|jgi:hypothetical protein|nr:hypothetical protein [Arcicella sp.]